MGRFVVLFFVGVVPAPVAWPTAEPKACVLAYWWPFRPIHEVQAACEGRLGRSRWWHCETESGWLD